MQPIIYKNVELFIDPKLFRASQDVKVLVTSEWDINDGDVIAGTAIYPNLSVFLAQLDAAEEWFLEHAPDNLHEEEFYVGDSVIGMLSAEDFHPGNSHLKYKVFFLTKAQERFLSFTGLNRFGLFTDFYERLENHVRVITTQDINNYPLPFEAQSAFEEEEE